ncbi:CPBP family intramembrane metalloprotease, partial [Mesorhizobium sp. M4B.F.Ca.ET.190.01.1.1]
MIIDSAVFERYRRSPNEKTTLLRLLLGTAIVVFLWLAMTFVVLVAGTYAFIVLHLPGLSTGRPVQDF